LHARGRSRITNPKRPGQSLVVIGFSRMRQPAAFSSHGTQSSHYGLQLSPYTQTQTCVAGSTAGYFFHEISQISPFPLVLPINGGDSVRVHSDIFRPATNCEWTAQILGVSPRRVDRAPATRGPCRETRPKPTETDYEGEVPARHRSGVPDPSSIVASKQIRDG
jgi:hypothetical protein